LRSIIHLAALAVSLALPLTAPLSPAAAAAGGAAAGGAAAGGAAAGGAAAGGAAAGGAAAGGAVADGVVADGAAGAADSPIGLWKTFDDKTGVARAIVRIYEQNGRLFGKIESSFTAGADHRVCRSCTDDRKDQPIIGLLIIRNMKHTDDDYSGGDILDPDNGSVYHCKMHVEGGTRLQVRGYIGFSLLGRNQTWERMPEVARSP
jgi:uncharacterized protein (DUF2147 family)